MVILKCKNFILNIEVNCNPYNWLVTFQSTSFMVIPLLP